ncbi:MAG: hypothetical protein IIC81_08280 [Chloroflexi bacterium]|nr:hypothetical protein [Chloroflexota bacterium]
MHGIFDLSVDQYKQLLEPLIEGTRRSWKSTRRFHIIAEIPVSELPSGGEVNVIHLDIEKPSEGRNRKGIRRAYITLDQEWYPSSILPKSTNPNNEDKILLLLKTLESFALVTRLVCHVAGVYNPDEFESVIPLPHPTSNPSAPDFSVVRGLRLSNRDESQSIVVDRRAKGELTLNLHMEMREQLTRDTIAQVIKHAQSLMSKFARPKGDI